MAQSSNPTARRWTPARLLVAAIVFTAGIGGLVWGHRLQVQYATDDAHKIHRVAQHYRVAHSDTCVSFPQLRDETELKHTMPLADPWGSQYLVRCSGNRTEVISLGPDKTEGTTDDISVIASN